MNNNTNSQRHTITALIENQPGVLARVVGLISGRGYNIESLNVGPTQDPTVSRMTMQVPGDDRVLEQISKHLAKQLDVIKVTDLTKNPFLNRECILLRVSATRKTRSEIIELADVFGGTVVAVQSHSLVVHLSAEQEIVSEFLEMMKPFKILDVSRSGIVAMDKE